MADKAKLSNAIDPKYRKPFNVGWKRELVLRSKTSSNKGDVYYRTPLGKKCSRFEILPHLTSDDGLDINDFYWSREPLGLSPEHEIIRTAIPRTIVVKNPVKRKISKTPEVKGEPCTIQCVPAMGTIPQLKCKKCLCLFHHECVGLEIYEGPISNYICESCFHEFSVTNVVNAPTAASNTTLSTTIPSLPRTKTISAQTMVAPTPEKPFKPNRPSSTPVTTSSSRRNDTATTASGGGSVIGGMTSWVPPTANLASSRSQLDIDVTSTQSIVIVAGRKYIMVRVSPSVEVKIGDNNSIPLSYFNSSQQHQQVRTTASGTGHTSGRFTPLTTGEPPLKKLLLSCNAYSRMQTRRSHALHVGTSSTSKNISLLPPGDVAIQTDKKIACINVHSTMRTLFATNFFNSVSQGYNVLLHTFKYLNMQELLRASRVCKLWNQAANNSMKTVRMKNSKVYDWSGLVDTLKRNGTKHLDLRKMIVYCKGDRMRQVLSDAIAPLLELETIDLWRDFTDNIGRLDGLDTIDLWQMPSNVIEKLWWSNPGLKVVNAVSILDTIQLTGLSQLRGITELRLRSLTTLSIDSLSALEGLTQLRHLSLISISELGNKNVHVIGNLGRLISLELGECSELTTPFATQVLAKLLRLERLRLEKGQDHCCTFDILDAIAGLPLLKQLELVNFDIKPDFDTHLRPCTHLKRLLIIPTYISQTASTNHKILTGVLSLADNLEELTWVVTLELLSVTDLYTNLIKVKQREPNKPVYNIPVLKPVPGMSDKDKNELATDVLPQVHILPLDQVEKILRTQMPNTKFSILKVPFHATWRQNM